MSLLCMFPAVFSSPSSCLCMSKNDDDDDNDKKPLFIPAKPKLKDVIAAPPTLAFQLKPKMVVLRVSMHCNGCARKVEKHISKLEGVSWYKVDLETKMVVVRGDIVPLEVLESVSKVKYAELWEQ